MLKALAIAAAALTLAMCGCASRPKPALAGQHAGESGVINPFAPVSMQIHPLTRVDRGAKDKLWIIVYIELKDSWGDTTKGTGRLQIQLYRPSGARAAGIGSQELTWDVDLSDLDRNASLYDPATRTYRLPLEEPPAWVGQSLDPATRDQARVRLRAVLTTTGPDGKPLVLQSEYTIGS